MTQSKQIYKCEICGNMVEVVHIGVGTLVCCNQEMALIPENSTVGEAKKHIPMITEESTGGSRVTIGEIFHPMTEEHHIEWIEVTTLNGVFKHKPKIGTEPSLKLPVPVSEIKEVRAYCNLHGLYVKQL